MSDFVLTKRLLGLEIATLKELLKIGKLSKEDRKEVEISLKQHEEELKQLGETE